MDSTKPTLTLNSGAERFELRAAGQLAYTSYTLVDRTLFLPCSEIPATLREVGWDDALLRGVYEYARAQRLRVVPICPLARAFLDREPQYQELVSEEHR